MSTVRRLTARLLGELTPASSSPASQPAEQLDFGSGRHEAGMPGRAGPSGLDVSDICDTIATLKSVTEISTVEIS